MQINMNELNQDIFLDKYDKRDGLFYFYEAAEEYMFYQLVLENKLDARVYFERENALLQFLMEVFGQNDVYTDIDYDKKLLRFNRNLKSDKDLKKEIKNFIKKGQIGPGIKLSKDELLTTLKMAIREISQNLFVCFDKGIVVYHNYDMNGVIMLETTQYEEDLFELAQKYNLKLTKLKAKEYENIEQAIDAICKYSAITFFYNDEKREYHIRCSENKFIFSEYLNNAEQLPELMREEKYDDSKDIYGILIEGKRFEDVFDEIRIMY